MYLSPAEAKKLLTGATRGKTVEARLRAAAEVIAQLNRIADHPDVNAPFNQFREQYLRDCLEAEVPEKALVFLQMGGFSAKEKREHLELIVALFLAMGKVKLATDWIASVSYVFGAKAVSGLAKKPGFETLGKSKAYLKIAGKDAEQTFFLAHLAEITRLWKRGEYDNWKDALQDAKGLVKDAKKLGKANEAKANKHLAQVVARLTKEMEKDPGLKRYLKGLL